jgi:hypothetical protein
MAVELLAGEPIEGESNKAIAACNDYLRMGIGRSLAKLHQTYIGTTKTKPPTETLRTLGEWSSVYGWQARAEIYDGAIDAEKTAQANARRKAIMESGLAQDYERVNELNEIYEKLKLEFIKGGLWYTDIKLSAKGDTVEVEVFNKPLIDSLRATLDDLAKETGGRKQKTEIGGVNGGPIVGALTTLADWNAQQDSARKQAQAALDAFDDDTQD